VFRAPQHPQLRGGGGRACNGPQMGGELFLNIGAYFWREKKSAVETVLRYRDGPQEKF